MPEDIVFKIGVDLSGDSASDFKHFGSRTLFSTFIEIDKVFFGKWCTVDVGKFYKNKK